MQSATTTARPTRTKKSNKAATKWVRQRLVRIRRDDSRDTPGVPLVEGCLAKNITFVDMPSGITFRGDAWKEVDAATAERLAAIDVAGLHTPNCECHLEALDHPMNRGKEIEPCRAFRARFEISDVRPKGA